MWGHASCHKNYILLQIFFSNKLTSNLGVFNIFKANKINIKFTLQKRNFKVLVFKSRKGHCEAMLDATRNKYVLLTIEGIFMNFSLELLFFVSSHPVTSKQPHKIVQILLSHPVYCIPCNYNCNCCMYSMYILIW